MDAAPPWLKIAESYLGTRELVGADNPIILGWLDDMGNIGKWGKSRDETAWCAAFVHGVLKEAGYQGSGHALARSYIEWGVPSELTLGSIVVLKYKGSANGGTGSRAGYHVALLIRENRHSWRVIGGNQGNGVNYRNFPKRSFNLVACRRPDECASSTAAVSV